MRFSAPTTRQAEIAALDGLAYLVGCDTALARFIESSGISPGELKSRATERDFLAGVLDFLLADDSLLMGFCGEAALAPEFVHLARRALSHR